jgi:aerobic carbon-monoxide dehydrogenase small subunit
MATKHMVSFKLNGKDADVVVEPRELLIHTLRERLLHTGPHIGCETSHCGACTVDLDGMSVKSCTVLTVQCAGAQVLTVEGLEQGGVLHALQQAFHEEHALQCGFCTPGMLATAHALLTEEPDASKDRIREVLSGNLCRCTGYIPIVEAVFEARAAYRK